MHALEDKEKQQVGALSAVAFRSLSVCESHPPHHGVLQSVADISFVPGDVPLRVDPGAIKDTGSGVW